MNKKTFGYWTVIRISKIDTRKDLCQCRCGTVKEIFRQSLSAGKSKSCGCRQKESWINKQKIKGIYVGAKFKNWTIIDKVIENDNTIFICECICGKLKRSLPYRIQNSSDCGCILKQMRKGKATNRIPPNFIDVTGQQFRNLIVLRQVPKKGKKTDSWWECKCICGNIFCVSKSNLNRIKECFKCARKHGGPKVAAKLRKGKRTTINTLYGNYKRRAKYLNVEFTLTSEHFEKLIFSACFYCGRVGTQICYKGNEHKQIVYNGIDRMNSDLGYIESNCVSCCKVCNYGKSNMDYDAWLNYLDSLVKYRTSLAYETTIS